MNFSQLNSLADRIDSLPTDETVPSHNELKIVNSLFEEEKGVVTTVMTELRADIMAGLLLIVLSLPIVDEQIKKFIPVANNSEYVLLGIKGLLMVVLLWFIRNFALSRK
jgi:hypothetical protein